MAATLHLQLVLLSARWLISPLRRTLVCTVTRCRLFTSHHITSHHVTSRHVTSLHWRKTSGHRREENRPVSGTPRTDRYIHSAQHTQAERVDAAWGCSATPHAASRAHSAAWTVRC